MDSKLKKKILQEILLTPYTVMPLMGGVSLLLMAEILGGLAAFAGFVLIVMAFGVAACNLLVNYQPIAEKAMRQVEKDKRIERNYQLDELDKKLLLDRDPRDQTALRNLRSLYDEFIDDIEHGKITVRCNSSVLEMIEGIFKECVSQLEKQHLYWETSNKVVGETKERLLRQRDGILKDVEESIARLAESLTEIRTLNLKSSKTEVKGLQNKLHAQLEAAKALDSFNASLQNDMSRFAEYTN